MEIYVQSRGLKRDYYWVVKRENQSEEFSVSPNSLINKANRFIESQAFSVAIFRSKNRRLLLLVTGLKTQRKDEYGRKIRNCVAWIGEDEDEPLLRQLAALALKNELKIDEEVIKDNNSTGFQVEWEAIEQLHEVNGNIQSEFPPEQSKIARISEDTKQQLAERLMKSQLPKTEGALVIVTGTKSKETLEEAQVWRGLSNDYRIPESWQPINEPPQNLQTVKNSFGELGTDISKFSEQVLLVLLFVMTVGVVVGWTFLRLIIKF